MVLFVVTAHGFDRILQFGAWWMMETFLQLLTAGGIHTWSRSLSVVLVAMFHVLLSLWCAASALVSGVSGVPSSSRVPSIKDDTTCIHEESMSLGGRAWRDLSYRSYKMLQTYLQWVLVSYRMTLHPFVTTEWLFCFWSPWFSFPRWWPAEDHVAELQQFMRTTQPASRQVLQVLDIFGASKRVTKAFEAKKYAGFSYDVKLGRDHDLTTRRGVMMLLQKIMQTLGSSLCCLFWTPSFSSVC